MSLLKTSLKIATHTAISVRMIQNYTNFAVIFTAYHFSTQYLLHVKKKVTCIDVRHEFFNVLRNYVMWSLLLHSKLHMSKVKRDCGKFTGTSYWRIDISANEKCSRNGMETTFLAWCTQLNHNNSRKNALHKKSNDISSLILNDAFVAFIRDIP